MTLLWRICPLLNLAIHLILGCFKESKQALKKGGIKICSIHA